MSEREKFMSIVKQMWLNMGRPEASWNAVHDWDYMFRMYGSRADGAVDAFKECLGCE